MDLQNKDEFDSFYQKEQLKVPSQTSQTEPKKDIKPIKGEQVNISQQMIRLSSQQAQLKLKEYNKLQLTSTSTKIQASLNLYSNFLRQQIPKIFNKIQIAIASNNSVEIKLELNKIQKNFQGQIQEREKANKQAVEKQFQSLSKDLKLYNIKIGFEQILYQHSKVEKFIKQNRQFISSSNLERQFQQSKTIISSNSINLLNKAIKNIEKRKKTQSQMKNEDSQSQIIYSQQNEDLDDQKKQLVEILKQIKRDLQQYRDNALSISEETVQLINQNQRQSASRSQKKKEIKKKKENFVIQ